ncbi:transcription factor IIH subunit [Theileria orientalis]|uniref:General transcription factor IIH subunit 4 n=1 Tax=Theileria orientalis TaxID=68886 RepID=A0A976QRZ6_THEOR|nr:transcription factor IIH subunit [Theileria orientalis]
MSDVVENEQQYEEETEFQSVIEENFFNYLKELDERVWQRLFRVKACLLALFRSLGELEKLIIYRLLYINQAVSERALRLWMCSHSISDLKNAFTLLQSYKIIQASETTTKEGKQQFRLHPDFKNGLISLLSNDENYKYSSDLVMVDSLSNPNTSENLNGSQVAEEMDTSLTDQGTSQESPPRKMKSPPKVEDLIKHAKLKLDFILLFLVSPDSRKGTMKVNKISRKIRRLKKQTTETNDLTKKIDNLEKKFNRLSKNAGVISLDLLQIFRRFGMVDPPKKGAKNSKTGETKMSRQTLSWLLKDVTSQMTSLLVGYVQNIDNGCLTNIAPMNRNTEDSQKSSVELKESALNSVTESVELLLSLSQSKCGDCFSTENLTKTQMRLVKLLHELGIVYYKNANRFYIYDLSYIIGKSNINVDLFKEFDVNIKAGNESRIIVQSNFKVYVYTASPLQISVLSHLCELQARTPNLVVGVLTRESVQSAFKSGITSNEIIRFLSPMKLSLSYAGNMNPFMDSSFANYKIPENVCRQLKMWESERDRIELNPAILFKRWDPDFMPELFQRTVRWAQSKRYDLFFTQWPSDPHSPEFDEWMSKEKYLACKLELKEEIINQIRLIRTDISNERNKKEE